MNDGEIQRNFKELREEIRRGFKDMRDEMRLTSEAHNRRMDSFVTVDAWTRENDHLKEEIKDGDKDCRERTEGVRKDLNDLKKSKKTAWDRVPLYLAVAVPLIIALLTAYGASKGK